MGAKTVVQIVKVVVIKVQSYERAGPVGFAII